MNHILLTLRHWLSNRGSQQPHYYCDYAAATPLLPEVAKRMDAIQRTCFGNPSAIHYAGAEATSHINEQRLALARTLGVRPAEIIFTASGSEANNMALVGVIEAAQAKGVRYEELSVVTTRIEHPSVLAVVDALAARGVQVTYLPVDDTGSIELAALRERLAVPATLVSFAYANSEVGTVQPVRRLSRLIKKLQPDTLIHLDAAQAPLWLPCDRHQLGVDLLSLDAGKCHGPKGVGVLVAAETVALTPLVRGGGQERGLRAGTENTAGIVGAAMAICEAQDARHERSVAAHLRAQQLRQELAAQVPMAVFNGPEVDAELAEYTRLPNNVHISLPGFDTEYAVVYLSVHGIAVSTKSACSGAGGGMSSVIYEMTNEEVRARSTIRFSLDPTLPSHAPGYIAKTLADWIALQETVRT